jgi:hypothetical protein
VSKLPPPTQQGQPTCCGGSALLSATYAASISVAVLTDGSYTVTDALPKGEATAAATSCCRAAAAASALVLLLLLLSADGNEMSPGTKLLALLCGAEICNVRRGSF